MSRYIDADALLEKYNVKDTNIAECLTDKQMARAFERFCIIADAVEKQPTVDAVPIEWIKNYVKRTENNGNTFAAVQYEMMLLDYLADGERS